MNRLIKSGVVAALLLTIWSMNTTTQAAGPVNIRARPSAYSTQSYRNSYYGSYDYYRDYYYYSQRYNSQPYYNCGSNFNGFVNANQMYFIPQAAYGMW